MGSRHARSIYGGKDPRDLPLYSVRVAAQLVGIPESTVRSWAMGTGKFAPVLEVVASASAQHLSFKNLVEIHVLSSLRRDHNIELQLVRKGIDQLRKALGEPRPLLSKKLLADEQRRLFIDIWGKIVDVDDGQVVLEPILHRYLTRIDYDDAGMPIRLFPFTSTRTKTEQRDVEIDPTIQFGKPRLAGTRIVTSVVADRWKAGDDIALLARDYGRSAEEIQAAVRLHLPAA